MNRTLTALLLAAFEIAVDSAAAGNQRCNALLPLLKTQ